MSESRVVPHAHEGDESGLPAGGSLGSLRLPAGKVLVVMLLALGLGALFNADRMVERAEAKSLDDDFRDESVWIWSRVQDVSHLLLLNKPREFIESAIGRDDEVDDDPLALPPVTEPGDGPTTSAPPGTTTTTTLPDLAPVVRAPTATQPLRFWVGGDSMAQEFGVAMLRVAAATGVMTSTHDSRNSTGLSRPDFFNWPAHLRDDVLPGDPEVLVIMFGANDSQSFELDDGTVCKRFEECWLTEYRRRVGVTMDLLRDEEANDRLVLWVGQPIMGPRSGVLGMDKLNFVYWDEARVRDWVVFVDAWPYFADADGIYADFLPAADGTTADMRLQDQVHLTVAGADRLAWEVYERMTEHVDLSASVATPPRSAIAPPEVVGRDVLPDTGIELIE